MSNWKKITTETYNKAPLNLSSDKWYTIAINQDGNASSRFNISSVNNDVTSGFIVFYASTSNDFENQITIISNTIGGQSYPVEKLRIISSGFGAALQIYVTTSTNNLTVRKTGDDSTTSEYKDGWKFINWVGHSNISPDTSENQMLDDEDWESLETTAEIPLKKGNMGLATTGNVYAENIHISDNTTSVHISASRLLIDDELNPHIFSVGLDNVFGFNPEIHIGGTVGGKKTYISSPENGVFSSFGSNYPTIGLQFDPGLTPNVYIGNNDYYLGLAYLTDGTPQIKIKGESIKIDGPITHVGGLTTDSIVLSTNTAGSTSDDIVVRDSSGNLKTIGANLLSPSNLWYNGTTYLSSSKEVHIHAPNPVLVLKDTTDDDDHQIQFQDNSGNVDYKITTAGDIFNIHTVSNTPIAFHTNNVERMRILNGGNVGIGTDVPHLPFHVKGNARVEGYLMAGSAAAANTPSAPLHIKNSGTAFIRLEDLDSSNSIYDISVDQGSGFSIKEDSNTRLFIKDGGSVGIGTTSPSEKLHVVGDIFSSADIHAHNAIGTPPSTAVLLDLNDLNNETAHEFYWANFVSVTGGVDSTAWYSDTRLPNRWFNGSNSTTDYAGWDDNLTPNTDTDDIDIRYKIANKLNYKPIVTKVVITQNASGNFRANYFKIYGQNEGESLTLLTTSDTIETDVKSIEFVNNTAYDDIIIRIANTDDGITSGDVSGILINQINIYGSAPSTATFDKFIGILEGTADNSKKIKIQSSSVSAGGGSFRLTLADTDETIGNSQPLYSDATLTYDIDTDTLTVPTITATTINTKVLRYQEFSADWITSTQKRYLPLSNATTAETAGTNQYYSRYIFTDDVAVSDVKIEMRMERSMNFKLEVLHHPLGGTLSSGFNQFNSNGFVYNNSNVFEHVLDSGPEGGFNKGDFLYIAIDPITGTSPGEVNGHLIICYDNEQTLTPGTNTAPNPISSESE